MAKKYDWKLEGAQIPPDWPKGEPWDGDYTGNYGQIVTQSDALSLADALEKALLDIPDEDTGEEGVAEPQEYFSFMVHFLDSLNRFVTDPGLPPSSIGVTSIYKDKIRELISFCRQGEFQIY